MQKWKIVCIIMVLCAAGRAGAQNGHDAHVRAYIEQYKEWAIAEQKRSGIPAAITLAQGIHETSAGKSELALNANNHFGIKCKKEWTGDTYKYTDDAPDECFRKYPDALQSYKDHSDYLAGSQRYSGLFRLAATDYRGWANGLKRAGYATNPKYAPLLIRLVEEYDLQQYTYAAMKADFNPVKEAEDPQRAQKSTQGREVVPDEDAAPQLTKPAETTTTPAPAPSRKSRMSVSYGEQAAEPLKKKITEAPAAEPPAVPEPGKLVTINGVRAFYAKKGTVLLEDAFKYDIRYARLLEINELPDLPLEADMYIFLDRKSTRGIHSTHIVKEGETLSQIAQSEGMQLKYLKYYNHIASNEEPMPGAMLQLHQYTENKPATYVKTIAPKEEPVTAFVGSHPDAIPHGATRKRAGYISKKEIEAAQSKPLAKAQEENPVEIPPSDEPVPVATEEVTVPQTAPETTEQQPAAQEPVAKKEEPVREETVSKTETTTAEALTTKKEEPAATPVVTEAAQPVTTPEQTPAMIAATEVPAPVVAGKEETDGKPAEAHPEVREQNELQPVTREAAVVENIAPARDTSDYEVVQPAPVVVKKEEAQPEVPAAPAAPAPEHIALATTKTDINAVAVEKPAVVSTPAMKAVPQLPEEPKDEYERLKRMLDKVVYASDNTVPDPPPTAKKAEEPKKEADAKKPEAAVKETPASKPSAERSAGMYTVKKGDTAFSIAKKHNITMRQLQEWNKLDFESVKVGQQLKVKP